MRANYYDIYPYRQRTSCAIPYFLCAIAAGFPSPAEDWLEDTLDLNDLLVKNPPATFLLRVSGDSMEQGGILDGSILVVDRSITPKPGMVIVATHDNGLTVKRYTITPEGPCLRADNPIYKDIPITENTTVWGVVSATILQLSK